MSMKKKGLWLVVLVIAIVLVGLNVFATKRATEVPTQPATMPSGEPTPIELTVSSSTKTVQHADYGISFDFPVTNSNTVNQEVATFVDETIAGFEKEILDFGPDLLPERQYTMYGFFETYKGGPYTTFVFLVSVDTGGAHPNHTFTTRTFDQYGARVGLDAVLAYLFGEAGTIERIATIAQETITEELGESASSGWVQDGTAPIAENFQDFYVDGEMLVLLFEPYTIGPYAWQSRTVRITRDQVVEVVDVQTTSTSSLSVMISTTTSVIVQ